MEHIFLTMEAKREYFLGKDGDVLGNQGKRQLDFLTAELNSIGQKTHFLIPPLDLYLDCLTYLSDTVNMGKSEATKLLYVGDDVVDGTRLSMGGKMDLILDRIDTDNSPDVLVLFAQSDYHMKLLEVLGRRHNFEEHAPYFFPTDERPTGYRGPFRELLRNGQSIHLDLTEKTISLLEQSKR